MGVVSSVYKRKRHVVIICLFLSSNSSEMADNPKNADVLARLDTCLKEFSVLREDVNSLKKQQDPFFPGFSEQKP